ncbi:MAG: acyltransferase family protein [Acidimicrobiales bacterium]
MATSTQLSVRGRHLPALDGIRALAILGVFAYHLGFGWASGGYLGVDLFFVLSGFLITSLLVEEWLETKKIGLAAFWGRRARRLLPGLLLMLVVLGVYLALFGPGPLVDLHEVRDDAIATVLYVANWHQLFAHQSYFDEFAAPSPLQHTWSLGIEEQFYLVWPLVVVGLLAVARAKWRAAGWTVALAGGAASAAWMAWLAAHGASDNRLYYGSDTRAFDLLIGAALAFLVVGRGQPGRRARRLLSVAAPVGLVVLGLFWWRGGGSSGAPGRGMFEWGFLACACVAAVVLADVRQHALSPLGKVLALPPLQFIGQISYELYLWHWPVICELTPTRLGFGGAKLDLVRVAVASFLSVASYYAIDRPVRRWAFKGWPMPVRVLTAPAGMVAASVIMVLGTVPPALASPPPVVRITVTRGPSVPGAGHMYGGPIHLAETPSRIHPLRIIMFGDSVMRDDATSVAAALQPTGVVNVNDAGFDGWGFTTDTGWRQNVPGAIENDHAQLVIAMWSFDNDYLMTHRQQYVGWMREFVHLVLSQPGVDGLIFEQFPALGPPLYSNPVDASTNEAAVNVPVDTWNSIVRSMVAIDPERVMYLPLGSAVERAGRYEPWLPPGDEWSLPLQKWVRVRMADAVHFCPAGAARYAAALVTDLRSLYHLPAPPSGWSTGSWTDGAQFTGSGACPDDHPPDAAAVSVR